MNIKKIIFLLMCLFFIDLILVLMGTVQVFDEFIYQFIHGFHSQFITDIMVHISYFSSTKYILFLNFILCILVLVLKKRDWLLIVIASLFSVSINTLCKIIIRRLRPIGIALVVENSYSFPSGHSMIAILFYGMIIYILQKYKIKYYRIFMVILGIYIFSVGISRIYLGVHFASDVIGGWTLGGAILLGIITLDRKKGREEYVSINHRS